MPVGKSAIECIQEDGPVALKQRRRAACNPFCSMKERLDTVQHVGATPAKLERTSAMGPVRSSQLGMRLHQERSIEADKLSVSATPDWTMRRTYFREKVLLLGRGFINQHFCQLLLWYSLLLNHA